MVFYWCYFRDMDIKMLIKKSTETNFEILSDEKLRIEASFNLKLLRPLYLLPSWSYFHSREGSKVSCKSSLVRNTKLKIYHKSFSLGPVIAESFSPETILQSASSNLRGGPLKRCCTCFH